MKKTLLFMLVFWALLVSACEIPGGGNLVVISTPTSAPTSIPPTVTSVPAATATEAAPGLMLTSPAFSMGEAIPKIYSCGGSNISPALAWNEPPVGTQTFALIVDDPDAPGVFVHWVIYDIPADQRGLPENIGHGQELEDGIYQGLSGGAVFGYVGMCPPAKHHYSFRLYALDIVLEKQQGVGRQLLQDAMQGHILAESELIGTYAP
jgi:Raf kinase inhibitor-like YbhB/YbcL family protein